MPHDIQEIITRISPGKYDAQRAARFDIERAKGALVSSLPVQRILNFNEQERTADFAFASDEPIEHWFGMVILDTNPSSVDLSRVESGVCPFLVNHNADDLIGVIVPGSVTLGPVIRGKVKFSQSARGQEILTDVKDEIRNGTSIGFQINDMILESSKEGEMPVYRATSWTMLENSSAPVPADYKNVGAGRSFERPISDAPEQRANSNNTENTMPDIDPNAAQAAAPSNAAAPAAAPVTAPATRAADLAAIDEIRTYGETLKVTEIAEAYIRDCVADNGTFTGTKAGLFARIKASQPQTTPISTIPTPPATRAARVQEQAGLARSIGDAMVNSETVKRALEAYGRGEKINLGMDLPNVEIDRGMSLQRADTTFTSTAGGLDTTAIYLPRPIELIRQQRLTIRDLLPVEETTQATVKWIKENSFTNDADMVAEGGQKPYSELSVTVASSDVKKIAILQKITDELWEDFPRLRDYVNSRTTFKLQAKEEQQLLNGTGSGQQIRGLLNFSGIQAQAKSSDTNLDAIHKAITKVREVMTAGSGGYEPDAIVMHPTDYELIRLAKDTANQYYGGGPFQYGPYGNGGYQSLANPWGLLVVVTTAISAGTSLVGDFKNGAAIIQRTGVRIELFNQNVDDVETNMMTLRVEERLTVADYADTAFCKVTGVS